MSSGRIQSVLASNNISVDEARQWLWHFDPDAIGSSSLSGERWLEIEKILDSNNITAEELTPWFDEFFATSGELDNDDQERLIADFYN